MAKKKPSKSQKPPTTDEVALSSPLARKLGINEKTMHAAVRDGKIDSTTLACGSRVVVVKSAKAWVKSPRKRGRKPAE